MSARDDILAAIARAKRPEATRPSPYSPPPTDDPVQRFCKMAQNSAAELRLLDSDTDVAEAVADILRARNLPARIHLPEGSALNARDWTITVEHAPPGPDDAAVSRVPFAIAETGTLAFPARIGEPASWHFRPGLEIAIVHTRDIVSNMEDVLARLSEQGLPPTLNFVTGPSRTGDIEQTLELGAHGPKALAILVVKD